MALTQDQLDQLHAWFTAKPTSSSGFGISSYSPYVSNGIQYSPVYDNGASPSGEDAEGHTPVQTGWESMPVGAGPGGTYTMYDMNGQNSSTHPIMNGGSFSLSDFKDLGQAALTLGSMYLGGQGLAALGAGTDGGILGSGIGAGSGAGTASGLAGDATAVGYDPGALTTTGGTSTDLAGSVPGSEAMSSGTYNPAADSQLANTNIAANGGDPLAGYGVNSTDPTISNFAPDGTGSGTNSLSGSSVPGSNGGINPSSVAGPASNALNGNGGNSGNGSPFNLGNLGNLFGGLLDYNNQNQAANNMLKYLQGQQSQINNMYAPGSPEYNQLWEQMSRQDAAAGRNSQYGPRSVDFAAKIAQIKDDANVRMTTGIANLMANAYNKQASAPAGFFSALNNGGNSNFSSGGSFLNALTSYLGGGGNASYGNNFDPSLFNDTNNPNNIGPFLGQ